MKKQFVIKSGQVLKNLVKSSAKSESSGHFFAADSVCCAWNEGFIVGGLIHNGQYSPSKPVFSL